MALADWLWLVRLIIENLKLLADLPKEELVAMANLRGIVDLPGQTSKRSKKIPPKKTDPVVT